MSKVFYRRREITNWPGYGSVWNRGIWRGMAFLAVGMLTTMVFFSCWIIMELAF